MNTFDLRLDLDKGLTPKQVVRIRQGDELGTTIAAAIFDHGTLVTTAPNACHITMRLPDGTHYYRKAATWADGTATVTIDETQAASAVGRTSLAYFQLTYGTDLLSTGAFAVIVEPDALADATVPESYDSAIQEAIDRCDAAVAAIENRVLVVLGDSWSDGTNDPATTWYMRVASKLGLTAYVTAAVAGVGFSHGTTGTIPLQVSSALTKVQQAGYGASDVKYVIAFGGVNDFRHSQSYSDVASGMMSTYDNARTAFPNAEIFIIGPNAGKWDVMDSLDSSDSDKIANYSTFPNYIHSLKSAMHGSGYQVVWDAGAWLNFYGKDAGNLYNSDVLHPNQTGHNVIAAYVCEILQGTYHGPHFYLAESGKAPSSGDSSATLNYSVSCDNGVATIQFEQIAANLATTSTFYWVLANFPLIPGGTNRIAYRAGFVCSNFNGASVDTGGYSDNRGYFRPTDRRLTIYPNLSGELKQVFGSVALNVY